MATLELDPVFVKALRLLHSKAKDSAAQLRTMVDDAIAARKLKGSDGDGKGRMTSKEEEVKKREAEKRKFEKVKTEISELEGSDPKKSKHDSPSFLKEDKKERDREKEKEKYRKEKDRREQEKERERQEKEKQKEQEREKEREKERARQKEKEAESDESTEEDDSVTMTMDAHDFAFDLDVCCVVCSKINVSNGNQLVECQECRALYHQECHKPPVTEQDVNDPRFVWYCNKCSKNMKKMTAQKPAKSKQTPPSSSSKEASSSKSSKSDPLTTTLPFRRVEVKTPTSSSKEAQGSSTSQPLSGLASLAANLSRPSSSKSDAKAFQPGWKSDISKSSHKDSGDKSSSRSTDSSKASKEPKGEKSVSPSTVAGASSSSKGAPGSGNGGKQSTMSGSSMANANKRLQLMKKAAAKQQEKRVHIK